jgi:hypothetical protein
MDNRKQKCYTCEYYRQNPEACLVRAIVTDQLNAEGIPTEPWPKSGKSWCAEYVEKVIEADDMKFD